jgi:hypothetical protein
MISYGFAFLVVLGLSIGSVSVVQRTTWGSYALGRLITGGTVGYSSSRFLISTDTWTSYIAACLDGYMGIGGYLFLFSFAGLIVVWGANLYTSDFKEVVR